MATATKKPETKPEKATSPDSSLVAINFKSMINKPYEMRIDGEPVKEGGLNCIGGWKATLKTAAESIEFEAKALEGIRYTKGDYLLDDTQGKGRTVAFFTMRKVSPRLQ